MDLEKEKPRAAANNKKENLRLIIKILSGPGNGGERKRDQPGQRVPFLQAHSVRWMHGRAACHLLRCWQYSSLPQPVEDACANLKRSSSHARTMADPGAQD